MSIPNRRSDPQIRARLDQRFRGILEAAQERDRQGQAVTLILETRFELHGPAALQYELSAAMLEEVAGIERRDVAAELISLGIQTVLGVAPSDVEALSTTPGGSAVN